MNLFRKIGLTLGCQMVGVAAVALANVIIAQRYGPTGQGYLSHYRSMVLLVAMVGAFGLPQALVYMINKAKATKQWTVKFSSYYTLLFGLACVVVFAVGFFSGGQELVGFGKLATIAIVLAGTGTLLHDLYRAISLASCKVLTFNLITIMPAVVACLLFYFWSPANYEQLVFVLVFATAISALIARFVLQDKSNSHSLSLLGFRNSLERFRFSFTFGFWSFLPGVLFNLIAVLTYTLLRSGANGDHAAGQFSIAVLVLTFALMPLERVMPLLFDSWSKHAISEQRRQSFVMLTHLGFVVSLIVAPVGWMLARPVILKVFGPDFEPAVFPTQVFILASYVFYQSRLLASLLLASGKPRLPAGAAVLRCGVLALVLIWADQVNVLTAVIAWTVGEMFAVAFLVYAVHKHTGWSFREIHGISPRWFIKLPAVIAGESP